MQVGHVEKNHHRRSRHCVVLTYYTHAPRAKIAAALLDDFFEHARRVLVLFFSHVNTGLFQKIFNRPKWETFSLASDSASPLPLLTKEGEFEYGFQLESCYNLGKAFLDRMRF